MTALLARLAQRAREPLSVIEPLAPPPFVAGGSGPEERAREVRAADRVAGRAGAASVTDVAPARDPGRTPGEEAARSAPSVADQDPPAPAPAPAPAPTSAPGQAPAPADSLLASGRGPLVPTPATEGRAAGGRRPDAGAQPETEPGAPHGAPAAPRAPGTVLTVSGRVPAAASATRSRGPQLPDLAAEPRREVTITIGHVEVRAAPPPYPSPGPAPFRPDVSLSEFLARQERRR